MPDSVVTAPSTAQANSSEELDRDSKDILAEIWGDGSVPAVPPAPGTPDGDAPAAQPPSSPTVPVEGPPPDGGAAPAPPDATGAPTPESASPPDTLELPEGLFSSPSPDSGSAPSEEGTTSPAPAPAPAALEEPPAPAPAPAALEEPPAPQGLNEQQQHAFDQYAYKTREFRRQNATLLQEMEELKRARDDGNLGASPEEVQEFQGKIKTLENRLGQYSLAETSGFQKEHDTPLRQRLGRIQSLMVRSGLNAQEAQQLTAQVFQQGDLNLRVELLSQAVPTISNALFAIFDEVDGLRDRRAEALRTWESQKATITENQKRESARNALENSEKLGTDAVAKQLQGGNFFFKRVEGKDTWNKLVDQRETTVKGVLQRAKADELSEYVAAGVTLREMHVVLRQEQTKRAAAETELSRIRGVAPGVGGGAPSGSAPSGPKSGEKDARSDEQVMDSIWGQSQTS